MEEAIVRGAFVEIDEDADLKRIVNVLEEKTSCVWCMGESPKEGLFEKSDGTKSLCMTEDGWICTTDYDAEDEVFFVEEKEFLEIASSRFPKEGFFRGAIYTKLTEEVLEKVEETSSVRWYSGRRPTEKEALGEVPLGDIATVVLMPDNRLSFILRGDEKDLYRGWYKKVTSEEFVDLCKKRKSKWWKG